MDKIPVFIKNCACGCGGKIVWKMHFKYYGIPKFLRGHNPCSEKSKEMIRHRTIKNWETIWKHKKVENSQVYLNYLKNPKKCLCGCDEIITWKDKYNYEGLPKL